jgi:UDP-2,3-diacylglucosamine hydrolase
VIYFAGDFHLGTPSRASSLAREKKICRWLEFVSADATEIYLMGDVFDFWFEYKTAVPRGFVRLLGTIAKLTEKGIQITVFKGNHDMWMFGYLEDECGVNVVSDALTITRNEKKFFLHHGDGLGPGDASYKFIRSVFRSQICQWLFARLHPNFGLRLGNWLSHKSRISQNDTHEIYLGDEKEMLVVFANEQLQKEHFDFFVFGHRHLVLDVKLNNNSRYINAGEWVHDSAYARFNGQDMEILRFEKEG